MYCLAAAWCELASVLRGEVYILGEKIDFKAYLNMNN